MRSEYRYEKATDHDVFIVDLNRGGKSVTNDAEQVTAEVAHNFPGRRIFYRDSEGQWDELIHDRGKFTGFAKGYGPEAAGE